MNYPLALALKSTLSFKLLSSDFSRKETVTLLKMLVKQYTAERKMISEYILTIYFDQFSGKKIISKKKKKKMISENIITDTIKRTCRYFNSFNFHQFSILMNDKTEYLQVLLVQSRFRQLQLNSPVIASLYIYKLKINAKP